MKRLPNGLLVFNATPHVIRFWHESWPEAVEVEPDELIDAGVIETLVRSERGIDLVHVDYSPIDASRQVIARARAAGVDVIIGSIIAAQAYPGEVVAMTQAPGFERAQTSEKRMNPFKFVVF